MPVLTGMDVTGVQRFVFISNHLRDGVGGSRLVEWSMAEDGFLAELAEDNIAGSFRPERVLMAGGGNALLEFSSLEAAHAFTGHYTRRLFTEAPGLELAVVHRSYEPHGLARALRDLQKMLAYRKTERIPSAPMLGLGVTASCAATRLPAVGFDEGDPEFDKSGPKDANNPFSPVILRRRRRIGEANQRLQAYLKGNGNEAYRFPLNLNQMGRTAGTKSMIGVVHVDGNRVGEKINDWLKRKIEDGAPDDAVREECGKWSRGLDGLGKAALQAAVDRVCRAKKSGRLKKIGIELLEDSETENLLPIRPILQGGDDLTLVCDGRIALDLAATLLSVFHEAPDLPHLGRVTACAGVAIAPIHAPFSRVYELCQQLCASAKAYAKDSPECVLDWQVGTARPGEAITDIRKRQYTSADGKGLTCRPYPLTCPSGRVLDWIWLNRELLENDGKGLRGRVWGRSRNKAKFLAEIARGGPEAVKKALTSWKVVNRRLTLPEKIGTDGFYGNRTPLLDALELLDLHQPLTLGETHYE